MSKRIDPTIATYHRLAVAHVDRLLAGDLTTGDLELLGVPRYAKAVDAELDARGLQ